MLGTGKILRKKLLEPILTRYPLAIKVLSDLRGLPTRRQAKVFGWIVIGALANSLSPLMLAYFIRSVGETNQITMAAILIIAAYFAMRLIDMVMGNLRWIMINPTLYLLSYQYAARSAQSIGESYSSRLRDGDLSSSDTSKTIALVQNAQSAFMNTCYNILCVLLPTAIATLAVVAVVFSQLGSMAFVVFLGGVLVSLFAMFWGRELEARVFSRAVESDVSVYSTIGEFVSNHQLVSEFSARGFFDRLLAATVLQSLTQHREYFGVKCYNECIRSSFGFTTYLVVMCLAIFGMSSELRTASDIFLIFAYMDRMNGPLSDIARAVVSIRTNEASGRLLDEFISAEQGEGANPFANAELGDAGPTEERRFISEVSDDLQNRNNSACTKLFRVIGESGSGKTTFLRQMKKHLQASFDGGLRVCSLHSKVPTVRGTVGENIVLGDEAMDDSVAQAYLDELLTSGTAPRRRVSLTENVERLSGGEMQALALVRVLLRRPQLVILDEATSAMDSDLEVHSLSLLRKALPDTVLIVVSHRPELAMEFDHQIYMNRWGPVRQPNP